MAWIYLAESEDSLSPFRPGCAHSPIVKSIDTAKASFCPECKQGILELGRYGTTCGHWRDAISLTLRSTLFTADSHARTSALRGLARAWKESEADWFSKSCGWSERFSQLSFFSKTSRQLELAELSEYLKNWPAEGMIVDGSLYPRQKSEPRTCVKDGSYWPTATATDAKSSRNLTVKNRKVAGHSGVTLTDFVTLYPTPSASAYGTNQGGAAGRKGKVRPSLETMARSGMWPTPRAADADKGIRSLEGRKKELERRPNGHDLPTAAGGKLNPPWVEWLMGYPNGWTELSAWATQWFRPKREKRSKD